MGLGRARILGAGRVGADAGIGPGFWLRLGGSLRAGADARAGALAGGFGVAWVSGATRVGTRSVGRTGTAGAVREGRGWVMRAC
ncbi:MAG: hypothetical protein BWK73_02945 [Thiothrix lacustris]|uniref:Uncharacterized protein n=1 Tax=Thiothrix lacustris TaxID=525917 RepID=A0A1Y1QZR4_9GAMM|nr:MAG: hypothetical protein BWK73_02945 [Thiothrix lacustris]